MSTQELLKLNKSLVIRGVNQRVAEVHDILEIESEKQLTRGRSFWTLFTEDLIMKC